MAGDFPGNGKAFRARPEAGELTSGPVDAIVKPPWAARARPLERLLQTIAK